MDIIGKWIAALRSGKYKQGKQHLKQLVIATPGEYAYKYCCLGVLCEINPGLKTVGGTYLAEFNQLDSFGLTQYDLATMNDKGESFETIADYIESKVNCFTRSEAVLEAPDRVG